MNQGFELLKKTIRLANSGIGFEDRLHGILDLLGRLEGIELAVLFALSPEQDHLEIKQVSPRTISLEAQKIPLSRTSFKDLIQDRRPLLITPLNRREHKALFRNPLLKGYNYLITLPVEDDNLLYGMVGLLSRHSLSPNPKQLEEMALVACELAGIIRNSKIYTESKKRIAELSVLYQVGKVIGSTLELDDLIQRTGAIIAQVINATGSSLMILDQHSGMIIVESEFGRVPAAAKEKMRQDILGQRKDTISNRAFPVLSGKSETGAGKAEKLPGPAVSGRSLSHMGVSLKFKGSYQGRLCVYEKISFNGETDSHFGGDDLSILKTIGNIIASALENGLTYKKIEALARKNEQMVQKLSILHQIDNAMMTTGSLDVLPHIILEAITLEEGLGFDRAVLLLADEENKALTPLAWSLKEKKPSDPVAQERPTMSPLALGRFLVEQAARLKDTQAEMPAKYKDLKIALTSESGILARSFLESRSFLIEEARTDPRTNKELVNLLKLEAFAVIPVVGKDRVIGVIAVDNSIDKRPLTQEDLHLLSMLAHQAGQALENARLYDFIDKTNQELKVTREKLLESEKMVAIGEMASGLAHEIRNPLVSIGGFVRRLNKKFQEDPQVQTYYQVIINEVERLEKILNEIMEFYEDPRGKYKEWDLNRIVDQALGLIQKEIDKNKITIQKSWNRLPAIFGDDSQLRHVFYNLFQNSCQAMPHGGQLTLRTFLDKGTLKSWVVCEIRDTGGGIPLEHLHNIFNPFFTTKTLGSGLGLSIVHKIITRHQGEVDIDNRPGEGVSFLIKLPLAEENQHLKKTKTNGEENHESDLNRR
jgi:signal transduction histidine kinase